MKQIMIFSERLGKFARTPDGVIAIVFGIAIYSFVMTVFYILSALGL